MGEKEIKITYETLFEILLREKNRDELQKLSESFIGDVKEYLLDKKKIVASHPESNPFLDDESEKTERQLKNLKKMLLNLYDKREKKIISMALNKARTQSSIVDVSNLLPEEKELYESVLEILNKQRENVLKSIISPEEGSISTEIGDNALENQENPLEMPEKPNEKPKELKTDENNLQNTQIVKFLQAVQKFVGIDLEVYGPFEQGDTANLPSRIAEVLVNKGSAEPVIDNQESNQENNSENDQEETQIMTGE